LNLFSLKTQENRSHTEISHQISKYTATAQLLLYNTKMGVAHMPDRESNKLPNALEAFQMPKNTDVHTIPIIEKENQG